MDLFLSDAHTGASLLGSYKTQTASSSSRDQKKPGVGEETKADFFRTVSGVASSLYLVNPGAPADRERMVIASSLPESAVCTYKDACITGEAPKWCPFNEPQLHEHIFKRLEKSGLVNRSRFVNVPIAAAGELTGFRYSGGSTPQYLVFPIGSSQINWLTALRGSTRLGVVAVSARDASTHITDLDNTNHNPKAAMKRLRIWRSLNWIFEAYRSSGMMRYEPFSMGCALYQHEVERMQLKGHYERVILYLGDQFCKESVLLTDISRGGKASDFWTIVEAVIMYKKNHYLEFTENVVVADEQQQLTEDWSDLLEKNRTKSDKGVSVEKNLEAAINEMRGLGDARKRHVIDFANSCMTSEQREVLFRGLGGRVINVAGLSNITDAILYNTAKRGVWIMMHTLLKQIQFSILHLVGPKAHRILIMKIFMPALVALFLAQGGIGDSFVHGALTLEVMKSRVANSTLASMLSRDAIRAPFNADNRSPSAPAPARNFSEYDIATLYGQLTDCASIPLAVNVGNPIHNTVMNMRHIDHIVDHTINNSLAKQRVAANNRAAMRLKHRRKVQEQAARSRRRQQHQDLEEDERESMDEDDKKNSGGGGGGEEMAREEEIQAPDYAKRKRPNANTPTPLKRGKFRENVAGLSIETIQNDDRQVTVESIQKLLTARHTKNRAKLRSNIDNDNDARMATFASASASSSNIYSTDEMAEAFIKYVMNFFDEVFKLRPGSMLNSIHSNRRTEEGYYNAQSEERPPSCECQNLPRHSHNCLRERDALAAESKIRTSSVDLCDPEQVRERFLEIIMDPPSMTAFEDAMAIERVLQNEQMLSSSLKNPIFTAVLGAERGDLGRYIVLSNVVKFMNVLIACLVDGDLPLLVETRKHAKTSLERGKTRKRGCEASNGSSFDYKEAGHCPVSGLRDIIMPICITELKSIALETGRGGRATMRRQNCDHAFCRMLKFLFFSVDPNKSAESFIDPASRGTLFKLDDICRDRKKYESLHWIQDLIAPVKMGHKDWVQPGEYTSAGLKPNEDASPVDFYRALKMSMLDEGVITVPKRGNEHSYISSITSPADLLRESIGVSCEAYRPLLFDRTTILTTERQTTTTTATPHNQRDQKVYTKFESEEAEIEGPETEDVHHTAAPTTAVVTGSGDQDFDPILYLLGNLQRGETGSGPFDIIPSLQEGEGAGEEVCESTTSTTSSTGYTEPDTTNENELLQLITRIGYNK